MGSAFASTLRGRHHGSLSVRLPDPLYLLCNLISRRDSADHDKAGDDSQHKCIRYAWSECCCEQCFSSSRCRIPIKLRDVGSL
jgi:hypothetical protein